MSAEDKPSDFDAALFRTAHGIAKAKEAAKRIVADAAVEPAKPKPARGAMPAVPTFVPDPERAKMQLALFPAAATDPANPAATLPADIDGKRARGRPPGAINVATKEWQEFLLANYTSPLIGEARTSMMDPFQLAAALGCTALEAFDRIQRSRAFIARYMHQEMPKALDIKGAGAVTLIIGAVGDQNAQIHTDDAGSVTIEGTLVPPENESESDQ